MTDAPIPEILKTLVQKVARSFYIHKQVIIFDVLTRRRIVSDSELAAYTRMNLKELHRVCGRLKEDRLIRTEMRLDKPKVEGARALPKLYYVLDYKLFVDVTKWKMFKVRQSIEERMKAEEENKGFVCPSCGKLYTPLEVQMLINLHTSYFECEICGTDLEQNDNEAGVRGSNEYLAKFVDQTKGIVNLLKQTDDIVLPTYVPQTVQPETPRASDEALACDPSLIPFSHAGGAADNIVIIFESDETTAEKNERKRQELTAKLSANVLPAWHRFSTVSGEAHYAQDIAQRVAEDDSDGPLDPKTRELLEDKPEYVETYYANLIEQKAVDLEVIDVTKPQVSDDESREIVFEVAT